MAARSSKGYAFCPCLLSDFRGDGGSKLSTLILDFLGEGGIPNRRSSAVGYGYFLELAIVKFIRVLLRYWKMFRIDQSVHISEVCVIEVENDLNPSWKFDVICQRQH